MKKYERGKKNSIIAVITVVMFALMSLYCIYGIATKDSENSILGGSYQTQYGMVPLDEKTLYFSTVLFVGTTIYLVIHLCRIAHSKVLFDNQKIIFYLNRFDERQFSWNELKLPDVKVEWVVTDLISAGCMICFTFEDKAKLVAAYSGKGYRDLLQMLNDKGILKRFGMEFYTKQKIAEQAKHAFDKIFQECDKHNQTVSGKRKQS